mgnify:CR=1 FL=1
MKMKLSSLLLFVSFVFILSFLLVDSAYANTIKQYTGVPNWLQYKYWEVRKKNQTGSQYFFGNKENFTARNTNCGSFTSKAISYIKIKGSYVMTGKDPQNDQKIIWWFIKPINSKRIELGYKTIPMNSFPKFSPSHYEIVVGKRISAVTAMLH